MKMAHLDASYLKVPTFSNSNMVTYSEMSDSQITNYISLK